MNCRDVHGSREGLVDGGHESLLLEPAGLCHWSNEALAEVGSLSHPAAEPVQARGSPRWVAEWAGSGKSLPGDKDFAPCLWRVVGSACRLSVPTLVVVVLTSFLHQSCLLEGKGLSAALTLLFLSPLPFGRRC